MVFAVGGVLITAAAIAFWMPWFGLVDLREVVVRGNHHAAAADLVSLTNLQRGQSLFSLPFSRICSDVLQHPWVKSVSLERSLPHTLIIRVEERREVAWMADPSGGGVFTIGEGGVIVSAESSAPEAEVELRGVHLSHDAVGGVVLDGPVTDLVVALREGALSGIGVQRIDVVDSYSVELETVSGVRILLGTIDEALSRLPSLAAINRSLDVEDYEVIDLRYGGEATLAPR